MEGDDAETASLPEPASGKLTGNLQRSLIYHLETKHIPESSTDFMTRWYYLLHLDKQEYVQKLVVLTGKHFQDMHAYVNMEKG